MTHFGEERLSLVCLRRQVNMGEVQAKVNTGWQMLCNMSDGPLKLLYPLLPAPAPLSIHKTFQLLLKSVYVMELSQFN